MINWELVRSKGEDVFEALSAMVRTIGFNKESDKVSFLKTHEMMIKNGGWIGYEALNKVSVDEMEKIMYLDKYKVVVSVDWELAEKQGKQFVYELNAFLDGDYSLLSRKTMLQVHKQRIISGTSWVGFSSFNKVSLKEMELILKLKKKDKHVDSEDFVKNTVESAVKKVSPFTAKLYLKEGKDLSLNNLEYDDYSMLIELAELIGDVEWRNQILSMEGGSK